MTLRQHQLRYVFDTRRGRLWPIPAGGNGNGTGGEQPPLPDPPKPAERTFTQADLDRIAAREKAEGRTAAMNEVAETLGVPVEEAKKLIEANRQREEAEKSEAQKAKEAADRATADAEKAKTDAARERHDAKVERLLVRAGVPAVDKDGNDDPRFERVKRMVTADVGADDAALKAEVDQLAKDFPELFKGRTGSTPPAPHSDPGPTPTPPKPGNDSAFQRGADRALKALGKEPAKQQQ